MPSGSGALNAGNVGNSFSFLANVNVAGGDTIDFVVGNGATAPSGT